MPAYTAPILAIFRHCVLGEVVTPNVDEIRRLSVPLDTKGPQPLDYADPATGLPGLLVVIGLAILLGTGFAGFTVSAALGSGSAAATQGASFIFFPLTFLAPTFVPLDLLDGWLKTAARINPITYVLEAMRELINHSWDGTTLWQGVLACLLLAGAMYGLAVIALRVRTRRT